MLNHHRMRRSSSVVGGLMATALAITAGAGTIASADEGASLDVLPEAPASVAEAMRSVLLNEEFDGDQLDEGLWNRGWVSGAENGFTTSPNPNIEAQCYGDDNVSVSDGMLHLDFIEQQSICTHDSGSVHENDYTSGMVQTQHKFTVGAGSYIEARILNDGEGTRIDNWPAFWTNGESHNWPETGEIDIMEAVDGGRACASTHSSAGSTRDCVDHDADVWHTYGAHWHADGVIDFYYDGVLIGTREFPATDKQYLILNLAAWTGDPVISPLRMSVDHVRVWSEEAPAEEPGDPIEEPSEEPSIPVEDPSEDPTSEPSVDPTQEPTEPGDEVVSPDPGGKDGAKPGLPSTGVNR